MIPDFLNDVLKPEQQEKQWKVVEMYDPNTGKTIQELIDSSIVDDMAVHGLEDHEKDQVCEKEPVYNDYGIKIGEKTVCEAPDTKTEDCELVPVVDKTTGEVLDTKMVCNEIPLPNDD